MRRSNGPEADVEGEGEGEKIEREREGEREGEKTVRERETVPTVHSPIWTARSLALSHTLISSSFATVIATVG